MKILIIEDDPSTADFMRKGLTEAGHAVDVAHDGRKGLLMAASESFDSIVTDRMLPELDGLAVIRTLRATGNTTPVLVLSALGEVDDRVEGLKAGGDDYLVKPYAFSELLARLEALDRRGSSRPDGGHSSDTRLTYADLEMDLISRQVRRGGKPIDLKPREYLLLEILMRHAGRVMTRTMLLEKVWNYHFDPQTNLIDVHISRLRNKIDKGFDTSLIQTVRGAGYSLRAG
ncbi:MAG: response regulator transcription factor [Geminicoccaceae bacterium]|nr:response regulator transcription factor [Geminicoccaceae bacterium]MCB9943256.1 response regulator transcription factor [Geminicoccaceae bacterium]